MQDRNTIKTQLYQNLRTEEMYIYIYIYIYNSDTQRSQL